MCHRFVQQVQDQTFDANTYFVRERSNVPHTPLIAKNKTN